MRGKGDMNHELRKKFVEGGRVVNREEWQAMRDSRPMTVTYEIADVDLEIPVLESVAEWQSLCEPNLPWAEAHFQERVNAIPLNPGDQYKNWPWYEQGVEEHKETGVFSHTYMERFWPKYANDAVDEDHILGPRFGVRFTYGDLEDVVQLLRERPLTRQAYLPIWFPEDAVAAREEQRVPCSLGYLFQYNPQYGTLDMWYYMRSVDFYRYLWDDIYMAGRLLQHVHRGAGIDFPIGALHMKIANLHVFAAEQSRLEEEYKSEVTWRLNNAFR